MHGTHTIGYLGSYKDYKVVKGLQIVPGNVISNSLHFMVCEFCSIAAHTHPGTLLAGLTAPAARPGSSAR
jgi:hypothetical protein